MASTKVYSLAQTKFYIVAKVKSRLWTKRNNEHLHGKPGS